MKKQLFGLLPLLFGMPLLGNSTPDPRLSFFEVPTYRVEPINEQKTNLWHSLPIAIKENCYLRVTMIMMNDSLRGRLINPTGDPEVRNTEGYVLIGTSAYAKSYQRGSTLWIHWNFPAAKLLDRNTVSLSIEVGYSESDSSSHLVVLGFPAFVIHPMDFSLSGTGSANRNVYSGCLLRYPSQTGMELWKTEYKGFDSRFENPRQNAIPLALAQIRSRDYDGAYQPFVFAQAFLRLHQDEGVYTIGIPGGDAYEKWRDFPLKLGATTAQDGQYASFSLLTSYAVSPDGRYMKPENQKSARDVLTHRLFLPPVKNNLSKTYSFTLYINGAGEEQSDRFHWDFSVYKDKNYFGSLPNSDYTVEVS